MPLPQEHIDRLVQETQAGNTKAFGELYDLYFQQIYKYVFYKVSEDQVDDLVGTVFIKAWSHIQQYKKGAFPFSSWLFRIAHNTVVDHYRTHRDFYELEERIIDDSDRVDPAAMAEKTLNAERVHRALKRLDKNYQEVILLKFMNQLGNREVADIMHTNEANIRTLQFRALKKLREIIEAQQAAAEKKLSQSSLPAVGWLKKLWVRSPSSPS